MPKDYEEFYFIDPEDKEFKETIKNVGKKLETQMAPAMLCKISKNTQNCGNGDKSNKTKSKLACILEASELQDCVWENHYRIIMKTVLQEKETIHCSITIWFTHLFLCSKPWKSPQKRQQWTRNGKNGENFCVEPDESQKQKRGDR